MSIECTLGTDLKNNFEDGSVEILEKGIKVRQISNKDC